MLGPAGPWVGGDEAKENTMNVQVTTSYNSLELAICEGSRIQRDVRVRMEHFCGGQGGLLGRGAIQVGHGGMGWQGLTQSTCSPLIAGWSADVWIVLAAKSAGTEGLK